MNHIEQLAQQIIKDRVVIKSLNKEHGVEIIKAFKERGINIGGYQGEVVGGYYGIIGNKIERKFDVISKSAIKFLQQTILTLPEFIARYPLEPREIVGWKFKDLDTINYAFDTEIKASMLCDGKYDFHVNSPRAEKLKQLGILEILCTTVYKEVEIKAEIPPKGTPVLDEYNKIWISKGILFGNNLGVCRSPSSLDSEITGTRLSSWTIYKGGEQ